MTTMLTENDALSGMHVQDPPLNAKLWVDPEIQALAGILDEELERYTTPQVFDGDGRAVSQPSFDPAKPHQEFPPEMFTMSDDEIDAALSETTPPGKAG